MAELLTTTFDTTALESPADRRVIEAFWERDDPTLWRTRRTTGLRMWAALTFAIGLVLTFVSVLVGAALRVTPDSLNGRLIAATAIFFGVGLILAPVFHLLPGQRLDSDLIRRYRLRHFSRANQLKLTHESITPADLERVKWSYGRGAAGYPGSIFNVPDAIGTMVFPRIKGTGPTPFRAGHCEYQVMEESTKPKHWVFVEFPLARNLPHIWLRSRHLGSLAAAQPPQSIIGGELLSLEGDFDRYFLTYARNGVQQEALAVLTPDVMALLIDNASRFDVEIIDDRMYLYSHGYVDVLIDPDWWSAVADVMNTVTRKVVRTSGHYTAAPDTVRASRRIRMRARIVPRIAMALGALVIAGGFVELFFAASK